MLRTIVTRILVLCALISPAFAQQKITERQILLSDVTTNNASTSNHGFLKKLDGNALHFMDGSGAWSTPAGSGTVTSVGVIVPSPLSASGSPVTTSGSITVTWGSGQIPVANLGSGSASSTKVLQGDGTWVDRPYIVGAYVPGAQTNSQVFVRHVPSVAVTVPSGCTNSTLTLETAATASTTYTVKKNGSSVGTAVVGISGTSATFTCSGSFSFNGSSDVLTVSGPASADATAAGFTLSLYGTR